MGGLWRSVGSDEGELLADLESIARERKIPVAPLAEGEAVSWRDARMTVLHSGGRLRKKDGINNQSLVLLFERHGRRSLLTGDIGDPAEKDLLARGFRRRAPQGRLTGPHVHVRVLLLGCPRRPSFPAAGRPLGHPHPETLRRWRLTL